MSIKLEDLTTEQKAALAQEIKDEAKKTREEKRRNKQALKELTEEVIDDNIDPFINSQIKVETHIVDLFSDAEEIIKARAETYGAEKKDQDSHTFTKDDGTASIKIGWNIKPTFNGTEGIGIQKVKEYMATLAGDDENEILLMDFLNIALKTDSQGNYNPKKVRELNTMRDKANSELFNEGMDIIEEALKDIRTSMYARGYKMVKGEDNLFRRMEFSFSIKSENV